MLHVLRTLRPSQRVGARPPRKLSDFRVGMALMSEGCSCAWMRSSQAFLNRRFKRRVADDLPCGKSVASQPSNAYPSPHKAAASTIEVKAVSRDACSSRRARVNPRCMRIIARSAGTLGPSIALAPLSSRGRVLSLAEHGCCRPCCGQHFSLRLSTFGQMRTTSSYAPLRTSQFFRLVLTWAQRVGR